MERFYIATWIQDKYDSILGMEATNWKEENDKVKKQVYQKKIVE